MTQQTHSFDWTIAPATPETFFADHFEKKNRSGVARDDPGYYSTLLSFEDIQPGGDGMGLSSARNHGHPSAGDITQADYAYESA